VSQLLDDLKAVRDLLAVPERWTQEARARTATGDKVDPENPAACCWCISGAVSRVATGEENSTRFYTIRNAIRRQIKGERLVALWNDDRHRTHADVIALLDKTIAAEERK